MTKAQARTRCRQALKIIAAWKKERRLTLLKNLDEEVARKKQRAREECKRAVASAGKPAPKPRKRRKAPKKKAVKPRRKAVRRAAPKKKVARKRAPKRKAARKRGAKKKSSRSGSGRARSRASPASSPAPKASTKSTAPTVRRPRGGVGSLESRIHAEAMRLGGGRISTRVRIADLHEALPGVPLGQLHEELLRMQDKGALVLYRIDFPPDIKHRDEAAALRVAGHPRHILYLTGEATRKSERPAGHVVKSGMASHFEHDFEKAFRRIAPGTRSGLVYLSDLRKALHQYSREQFDRGLRQLREGSDDYVLQTFDGRHGQLSDEQHAAGIREGGRLYMFVKRRE